MRNKKNDYPATLHKVESQLLITACAQPGATCSCPSLSSFPLGSCFHRCLHGCFHLCFPDPGTVTASVQGTNASSLLCVTWREFIWNQWPLQSVPPPAGPVNWLTIRFNSLHQMHWDACDAPTGRPRFTVTTSVSALMWTCGRFIGLV